jgi:hypothetical protein
VPQRNEVSNLKSLTQEIPKKYFVKREAQTYSTPIPSSYKPFFVPPQLQPRNFSTTAENLKPSLIHTAYQSQNTSTAHQPVKANLPAHYSTATYFQNEVRYNRPVNTHCPKDSGPFFREFECKRSAQEDANSQELSYVDKLIYLNLITWLWTFQTSAEYHQCLDS